MHCCIQYPKCSTFPFSCIHLRSLLCLRLSFTMHSPCVRLVLTVHLSFTQIIIFKQIPIHTCSLFLIFFFLNTDDTQCNARMTSETLLINCSSRVHISFTVYFGLAFAFSLRFAFAYRSACAHCSNGKVKCFRNCTIKQLHMNRIQKNICPILFLPL